MHIYFHEIKDDYCRLERVHNVSPTHVHTLLEIVRVKQGSFDIGIRHDWVQLNKGDVAVIFPGVMHQFRKNSDEAFGEYDLVLPDRLGMFNDELTRYLPERCIFTEAEMPVEALHALDQLGVLYDHRDENNPYQEQMAFAYLEIFLGCWLPLTKLNKRKESEDTNTIFRLASWFSTHYREDISLLKAAKELGMSSWDLSRIFSGKLNTNFNTYVNTLRLDYACRRLRKETTPITEIALDAGFGSQVTFNRVFKEFYHMSPRDYRNQFKHILAHPKSYRQEFLEQEDNGAEREVPKATTGRFV